MEGLYYISVIVLFTNAESRITSWSDAEDKSTIDIALSLNACIPIIVTDYGTVIVVNLLCENDNSHTSFNLPVGLGFSVSIWLFENAL